MPIYKQGAVAHVAALLLFVESKNKKHVFVKIKACATDFLENQKFSNGFVMHMLFPIVRLYV